MIERFFLSLLSILLSLAFSATDQTGNVPQQSNIGPQQIELCGYEPQGLQQERSGHKGEGQTGTIADAIKRFVPNGYLVFGAQANIVDFGDVYVGDQAQMDILVTCIHGPCMIPDITSMPAPPFYFLTVLPGLEVWVHSGQTIHVRIGFEPPYAGYFEGRIAFIVCSRGGERWEEPQFLLRGRGISSNNPPSARCSYSPSNPTTEDVVSFSGEGSYDPDEGDVITSYRWDFGDGATARGSRVSHRYRQAGNYTARLTVTDSEGASDTDSCSVDVEQAPSFPVTEVVIGGAAAAGAAYYAANTIFAPSVLSYVPALALAVVVPALALYLFPVDQLIVRFGRDVEEDEAENLINQIIPGSEIIGKFPLINAYLVRFTNIDAIAKIGDKISRLDTIQAQLKAQPFVDWALKNYVGKVEDSHWDLVQLMEEDPGLAKAYELIRLPQAWEMVAQSGIRPGRIKVAVIDTGLTANHEEFKTVRRSGKSYVMNRQEEELPWEEDPNGHGTRVSGIIAAANGQGRMNGILAGVMSNYEIIVYRVMGSSEELSIDPKKQAYLSELNLSEAQKQAYKERLRNMGGTLSSVLDAINRAANAGAHVINLSLGWDRDVVQTEKEMEIIYDVFHAYMQRHPDVLFVSSAGNEGIELAKGSKLHAPGGILASNNITVAALDKDGQGLANSSNYGSLVDLAAPGVDVFTTNNDGTYVLMSGTSAAAPLVSGTAGLLRAIAPSLKPNTLKDILTSGGTMRALDSLQAVDDALQIKTLRDRQRAKMLRTAAMIGGAITLGILFLLR